jgi:predicted transcriptional regulator
MPKAAENQRKPWTPSDVAELQAFVDEEMTIEEIAHELGRTAKAVRAKAAEEGISLNTAAAIDNIDDD